MKRTLILQEDCLEYQDLIDLSSKVLGPSIVKSLDDFNGDTKDFTSLLIICNINTENIAGDIIYFLKKYQKPLDGIRIAILCICKNREVMLNALKLIETLVIHYSDQVIYSDYISNPSMDGILPQDLAGKLIDLKRSLNDYGDMPQDILRNNIDQILLSHNTCTLCTGYGNTLRSTPIEYTYYNGHLYFLSEGGEKFANLYVNPLVSISIYQEYSGFQNLEGIQIEGSAHMIDLFTDEYMMVITKRGLNASNIKLLPVRLNMFKVIPERIQVLKSEFKKNGYDAKQVLI
jgi:hypothetical protein